MYITYLPTYTHAYTLSQVLELLLLLLFLLAFSALVVFSRLSFSFLHMYSSFSPL